MKPYPTFSALVITSLLFVACSKEKPTPPPVKATQAPLPVSTAAPAATGEPAPPPPPGGATAAPAPAPAVASEEEKLPAEKIVLNAVQSFMITKERPPKDINELVSSGFLKSMPPAPPGKKIVFDPGNLSVRLENQ